MTHSSAMHGDRDTLTHNEEHSQSFSGYGHPSLDCNLLLLNSAVPNPTALGAYASSSDDLSHLTPCSSTLLPVHSAESRVECRCVTNT